MKQTRAMILTIMASLVLLAIGSVAATAAPSDDGFISFLPFTSTGNIVSTGIARIDNLDSSEDAAGFADIESLDLATLQTQNELQASHFRRLNSSSLTCNGLAATVYVSDGFIVGGPWDGVRYFGVLVGSNGDDVIAGTDWGDGLYGRKGNDTICGFGGYDYLEGNRGNDYMDGGNRSDGMRGGSGDDTLIGGRGYDAVNGNRGNDTCDAEREYHCELDPNPPISPLQVPLS